jgi:hypothetical protein
MHRIKIVPMLTVIIMRRLIINLALQRLYANKTSSEESNQNLKVLHIRFGANQHPIILVTQH